jgi:hypothetical protein
MLTGRYALRHATGTNALTYFSRGSGFPKRRLRETVG